MKITKTSLLVFAMLNVGLIASGCGKDSQGQSLVQGAQVSSFQQNGDIYVKLSSQLNTGGTQMIGFNLDITDPDHPGEVLGSISLIQSFVGTAELSLNVNLTQVADLHTVDCLLPNGTPIPVSGISAPMVCIPIGNGSRIYVAYGNGAAMIGVALAISEFNGMGGYVGNANIFPSFVFENGVRGIGGVFAGLQSGQSGIALFVDASGAVKGGTAPVVAKSSALMKSASSSDAVVFTAPAASSRVKDRVNKILYKLHSKRTRLHAL